METKTGNQKDICTPMFIAALFTIAKLLKQLKCPSMDEWMKKTWCVCVCVCVPGQAVHGVTDEIGRAHV